MIARPRFFQASRHGVAETDRNSRRERSAPWLGVKHADVRKSLSALSPRLLQFCCGPKPSTPPPFGDPLPGGRGVKRHLLLFWASCVYHRLAHPGPKGKGGGRGRGGGRGERPARRSAERVALTHATLHAIVSSALPPCARARRRNTPPEKSLFPDTSPMSRQQRLLEN